MNKNLLLIGGGLLALMVLKPANANTRARGFGNGYTNPGQSTWGARSNYYNNARRLNGGTQTSGAYQGASQILGFATIAKQLGLGDVLQSVGQSITGAFGAIGAASDAALASTATDYATADALTADWLATSQGSSAVADAVVGSAPWIAAAAAIDSEVFNGDVGQTIVDNVDGLGNSIASVFGW